MTTKNMPHAFAAAITTPTTDSLVGCEERKGIRFLLGRIGFCREKNRFL
jgi:hypothetical protein